MRKFICPGRAGPVFRLDLQLHVRGHKGQLKKSVVIVVSTVRVIMKSV